MTETLQDGRTATNLRQADNKIVVEGLLSEKDLKRETNEEGVEVIKGTLTIQTSEVNFIPLNVFVSKVTSTGKANNAFKGLETVMEQYKSIAEVGAELATKVRVTSGQLRPNTYFDENGMQHDSIRYSANYFNTVKERDKYEPRAELSVEVFINNVIPEISNSGENKGQETGRLLVKCFLPLYNNGIEPITLVAPADIAADIDRMYQPAQTVKFFCDIVNSKIVVEKTVPIAIGKPRIERSEHSINELLITGASEPYDENGIGTPEAYSLDVIKAAMNHREELLQEKKEKALNNTATTAATTVNKAKPASRPALW